MLRGLLRSRGGRTSRAVVACFIASLCAVCGGCSPLPYRLHNELSPDALQTIKTRYQGTRPFSVILDTESKNLSLTKATQDAQEKWYGDRAGLIFPIGHTFAAYLEQAQQAAWGASQTKNVRQFTARVANADLSYTMRLGVLNSYIDWAALRLTMFTIDENGDLYPLTLRREITVSAREASSQGQDLALTAAIRQLVLDYLDAVMQFAPR